MQSRPADQFHSVLLQVKVLGQNGFDVTLFAALFHWAAQFNHPAKLIAISILGIGQYELRVVLSGHGVNVRDEGLRDCAPEHNFPVRTRNPRKININHILLWFGVKFQAKATRCTELPTQHM